MARPDRSARVLLVGTLVSVAAHLAIMAGVVRDTDGAVRIDPAVLLARPENSAPGIPPTAEARREEPTVRLGLEHAAPSDTMTWLGSDEATEHEARKGLAAQEALSRAPGGASPGGPPSEPNPDRGPTPSTEPKPAASLNPTPPQPQPAPSLETKAADVDPKADSTDAPSPNPRLAEFGKKLAEAIREVAKEASERPPPAAPPPPPPTPSQPETAPQPVQPVPPTPPKAPSSTPGSGAPGVPGSPSDAESDPRSIKDSPRVHLGHVLAAQGLEISTRRPRWSNTTLLTRNPRNAVVVIRFDREGVVKYADFATVGGRRFSTGYDDVDEPLLNAIFSWTAKGEALRKLPTDDPAATVKIVLTVVLG